MNYFSTAICFMLFAFNSYAQDLVKLNEATINKTTDGNLITIVLPFDIVEGYHIQSEIESAGGSIMTEVMFEENDLFEIISFEYSKKLSEELVLNEYTHHVLIDVFEVTVTLKLNEDDPNPKLNGQLYYQACTNKQCLFPRTLNFEVPNI